MQYFPKEGFIFIFTPQGAGERGGGKKKVSLGEKIPGGAVRSLSFFFGGEEPS